MRKWKEIQGLLWKIVKVGDISDRVRPVQVYTWRI